MVKDRSAPSPLDAVAWPSQLDAAVVEYFPTPAVHGYDLETDLAMHYGWLDVALLALSSELPSDGQRQAIEVALVFAAACSVAEAPVHSARVARVMGVQQSALCAIAAMGLAEQARDQVAASQEFRSWLASSAEDPPAASGPRDAQEAASVEHLRQALRRRGIEVPQLRHELSREAALQSVLWWAGVREPEQVETLLVLARLPIAIAEALAARPLGFKAYPTGTPAFDEVGP